MKYALFAFLFIAICSPADLFAQSDIEEDGYYYSSGTVYNGDQLTGYFTLQLGKVDDEIFKYTIKLLDRNADQIGKTVYQRKNEFEFQRIFYNGTYLALQLKEGENSPYVDILDGAGERVTRKTFDHLNEVYLTNLWPVEEGFIFVTSQENTPDANHGQRQWTIGLLSNDGGEVKWEVTSDNPPETSHYIDLLDASDEMLLFSTMEYDERKRKAVSTVGLRSVDVKSGETLFTYQLAEDDAWEKTNYSTGNITANGFTVLQSSDVTNNQTYNVSNFDLAGKRLSKHYFSLKEEVLKDLDKKGKRAYRGNYWMVTGQTFTSDDQLQLAVQSFRPYGSSINFFKPQSVLIDTSGQLTTKAVASTKDFYIKSKYIGITTGFPVLSRKGKGMMQDIQFHGGPLPYAGQQQADDITIQYYFDREFTKEGVKYESIHAIYYLDGELIEEVIPFESDADMVRIYPGKPGYFLVMEAYSDGSIKTRLERMDF